MTLKAYRELADDQMAPGSPDILGWIVHDEADRTVGVVIDLLVDTSLNSVRYIGVQLGNGKNVLLPIGSLDLDEDLGVVKVVDRSRAEIRVLPNYTLPTLTEELEIRYYILFQRTETPSTSEPPDYEIRPFLARTPRLQALAARAKPRKPGDRMGVLASQMPWNIADVPGQADLSDKVLGDELQPELEPKSEVLWQAEQPGFSTAMADLLKLPSSKKPRADT